MTTIRTRLLGSAGAYLGSLAFFSLLVLLISLVLPQAASCQTWTPTGSMATGRANHTATLLQNGKVLVAGGTDSNGVPTNTAEIYDPATGQWTSTKGTMSTARESLAATLLPNGQVLVAGGYRTGFAPGL